MKEINGQFIMDVCAPDDPNRLDSAEELVSLLRKDNSLMQLLFGYVLFFAYAQTALRGTNNLDSHYF